MAAQLFYVNKEHRDKMWVLANTDKIEEEWIRWMLLLPREASQFATTGEHTCYKISKHMVELALQNNEPFKMEGIKLVMGVFLAGYQAKVRGGKESVLNMDLVNATTL